METNKMIGRLCNFAVQNISDQNKLFWNWGVLESENETHYFFNVNGSTDGYLKSAIVKMHFKEVA
jgi:hypothetical protein